MERMSLLARLGTICTLLAVSAGSAWYVHARGTRGHSEVLVLEQPLLSKSAQSKVQQFFNDHCDERAQLTSVFGVLHTNYPFIKSARFQKHLDAKSSVKLEVKRPRCTVNKKLCILQDGTSAACSDFDACVWQDLPNILVAPDKLNIFVHSGWFKRFACNLPMHLTGRYQVFVKSPWVVRITDLSDLGLNILASVYRLPSEKIIEICRSLADDYRSKQTLRARRASRAIKGRVVVDVRFDRQLIANVKRGWDR
ncbi:hypothetical protein HOK96_03460 [bacterium]|nr:hypothetical protein [bacterium]MBT6131424.1 hypothetical protein [bacterium]